MSAGIVRRLAERRRKLGWSQYMVAKLMGTSQSAVARMESGRANPTISTLQRYAEVVGMSVDLMMSDVTEVTSAAELAPAERTYTAAWADEVPSEPNPNHILTWRQRKILHMIRDYTDLHGYSPSSREIGLAVGLSSTSSVAYQLRVLHANGFLQRIQGRPRALKVNLPPLEPIQVPMVAQVPEAASVGELLVEGMYPLPRQVVGEGDLLLFEFRGDCMDSDRILDGDWVAARHNGDVDAGNLVAVRINGEITVRRLRWAGDQLWLMSGAPDCPPVDAEQAELIGPVVSVMRNL